MSRQMEGVERKGKKMTKKTNKKDHKKIIEKNFKPAKTKEARENLQEIMYGDENNPGEKFHTGEDTDYSDRK